MKKRLCLHIKGVVQGVGFRPFIYRLAEQMNLTGYIINSESGVTIEAESSESNLLHFIQKIKS